MIGEKYTRSCPYTSMEGCRNRRKTSKYKNPKPDVVDIRLWGSYGFNVLVRNSQNDMPRHTKLMTILWLEDGYTELGIDSAHIPR